MTVNRSMHTPYRCRREGRKCRSRHILSIICVFLIDHYSRFGVDCGYHYEIQVCTNLPLPWIVGVVCQWGNLITWEYSLQPHPHNNINCGTRPVPRPAPQSSSMLVCKDQEAWGRDYLELVPSCRPFQYLVNLIIIDWSGGVNYCKVSPPME
jgi:hypothetical protein